jgi:mRNA interferase MazF
MNLLPGDVVWVDLEQTRGREQGGVRPGVVVSSAAALEAVDSLAIVIPLTTRDRGWPNHVPVAGMTGLNTASWAMTEQPRCVARERILRWTGAVDEETFGAIQMYLRDALDL